MAAAAAAAAAAAPPVAAAQGLAWRNGDTGPASASAPGAHGRGAPPTLPGQPHYETLASAGTPASPYGKSPLENGGGSFSSSSGFTNGGAIVRAAMSMLPLENIPAPGTNHRVQMGLPQGSDATHAAAAAAAAAPFHDHNSLSAAAPEILTQMGYRRAPAYGTEGGWGTGAARGQSAPVPRMDAPPVLVLQPGWGVTLPPYFLGMMDAKRPRNVPVKVRVFLLAGSIVSTIALVLYVLCIVATPHAVAGRVATSRFSWPHLVSRPVEVGASVLCFARTHGVGRLLGIGRS